MEAKGTIEMEQCSAFLKVLCIRYRISLCRSSSAVVVV